MKPEFYAENRQRLINSLNGGLIVLSAYSQMQRGNDAAHRFEQEANFWWLTGIKAANWWVIIDGSRHKSWLVAPTVSDTQLIFDGSLSYQSAIENSGISEVLTDDVATSLLQALAKTHSVVHTLGDHPQQKYYDFTVNPQQKHLWRRLERVFSTVKDCRLDIARLRAIKQPEEISAIKKAIAITTDAFALVKPKLATLKTEYEVQAEFDYHFRRSGAEGHAYDPIVAGGANACTLHYSSNDQRLKNKSLLLLDIGARYDGYAADITRTYVIGEPTARQQQIHQAVETAHRSIIALLKPGLVVSDYNEKVDRIMKRHLSDLGLLRSPDDYRKYFPHAVSHGLGVDVHDALGQPITLETGMILTVEPGIYIPEESIGVRIEDDILITSTGRVNLSKRLATSL